MPRKTKALAVAHHAPAVVPASKRALSFGGKWAYAPAPESVAVKPDAKYDLFIGGKFVEPAGGAYFPAINPATEKPISQIAEAGSADVDAAVAAARKAFEKWSRMP